MLIGGHTRKCNSNGTWSDSTPFCDREMKLKILHGHLSLSHHSISSITDGNSDTCPSWEICSGCSLELQLGERIVIQAIEIFLKVTDTAGIIIETQQKYNWKRCRVYGGYTGTSQWKLLTCDSAQTDTIRIVNTAQSMTSMTICEIQVYISHDRVMKFKTFSGYISLSHHSISAITDGNSDICPSWEICAGCHLQFQLEAQAVVQAIRIFFKATDIADISIQILQNNTWNECDAYDGDIGTSQWIAVQCPRDIVFTNMISITNNAATDMTICEVEIYLKDDNGCEHSPQMSVANGYFEVSRNKATLICEDGYKSENGRLVCEGNLWKSAGSLCEQAKPIKYIIIGSVGAVAVIIILLLQGVIICLIRKQKKREVLLVFKSTDGNTAPESQYAISYYESIQPNVPSTPRPAAFSPDVNDYCILPEDCEGTAIRKPTPADIAFGMLKESIIYQK